MGCEKMELAPWFLEGGKMKPYIAIDDAIRWWFQRFFYFSARKKLGNMIQFDGGAYVSPGVEAT